MNRHILSLAIPNIISNITIPLLGMVGIAIAGFLGEEAAIGALAVGSSIFNMIYWTCGFIRMGASGLTAQAYGARRYRECANILVRSVFVAFAIAALLVIFQRPVGNMALNMMSGSDKLHSLAAEYFFARIWAAPASISIFAIHGWFIGMQDSRTPMIVAIVSNILNVLVSMLFVFRFDMGISGIAWGTVVAQYTGLALSWVFWWLRYKRFAKLIDIRESLSLQPLLKFFNINKDIFIRSLCNVAAYTFFTVASTSMGDVALATNTLLMQLFTLFSYMSDGFAYAAEALVGRFVGARDSVSLKLTIKKLFWWSGGIAAGYVVFYLLRWEWILSLFNASPAIIEFAGEYIGWVIAVPLIGFTPFLIDGILLGATRTKILRNTIFIAVVVYFALYYSFVDTLGNNAIWLAFISYILLRGILQLIATKMLNIPRLMKGYF